MSYKSKNYAVNLICEFLLIAVIIFSLFPVVWMVISSFKTVAEAFEIPVRWFPKLITLKAYSTMWDYKPFDKYFQNSMIVSLGATILGATLGTLAGYGISRFKFWGRDKIIFLFLTSRMLPAILLVIPYFQIMVRLNLYNTHLGLIIAYSSFVLPLTTWLALGFYESVPKELDEAAMIDGCSRLQSFLLVVSPIIAPGLVTIVIFAWIKAWNEYMFALCLVSTETMYTIPVGVASLFGEYRVQWPEVMAASTIATIPVIVLFVFIQKYLIEGLGKGAVKG